MDVAQDRGRALARVTFTVDDDRPVASSTQALIRYRVRLEHDRIPDDAGFVAAGDDTASPDEVMDLPLMGDDESVDMSALAGIVTWLSDTGIEGQLIPPEPGQVWLLDATGPVAETAMSYFVSLVISYGFLWAFGHVSPSSPLRFQVAATIVLAYVTSIGGAAGRVLVAEE